jgi:hypothetical protein
MLVATHYRRLLQIVTALSIATTTAACDDDEEVEPEPDIATMRLVIGTQTITVNETGTVTGGPILLARNTPTTVTATFLRADGTADPLVTTAEFRLNGTSDHAAVATFTFTSGFSGTITGLTAGTTVLRFSMFHIAEGHADFGPHPVPITVQ